MRIDHINICAPLDLMETVKDFYCTVLQLEDGPRPDFGIPGYWLYGDGKPLVHLLESANHGRAATPQHLDHVAFQFTGLNAFTARLDCLGVKYSVLPNPELKISQVFFQDPCGINLEANIPDEQ